MIVEGQVHGGVAQGVGGALYERMEYDESGQLLNASFMDFLMPYASEVPYIEIDHLETPSPLNPLGVKGAGEAGVIPGSAAIAAAIEDAEGIVDHRDADLAERAVRAAPGARRRRLRRADGAGLRSFLRLALRRRGCVRGGALRRCRRDAAGLRRVRPAAHRGRSLRGPPRPAPRHR